MSDIRFYHLTRSGLDRALPQLLAKALERDMRAIVMAPDPDRVAYLNGMLWTYDPGSFLPHGSAEDGMADQQPIWLTHRPENPNGADLIVLIDLAECDDPSTFAMCCLLFDGHDASAVTAARERWRVYREAGHSLSYWQQGERGGWEKKA